MKKLITLIMVIALAGSMCMTSLAGTWEQIGSDWKYQNDDNTYAKNGWQCVDSKYYYFDENGVMLVNTMTPDGETVDASGAKVINGRPVTKKYDGQWITSTTIKAEAPTLQDTGLCSFLYKSEAEIESALGKKQPCAQIDQYMFQGRPAAVFDISKTTEGTLCFGIAGPAAAFFTCSGSDTIARSQLEQALGVKVSIGMALYEERWYAKFVYNGCDFSVYSCSPEGTFRGDSMMSAINHVEFEHEKGFFDENGQWISI
ncbi:hypothetical protein [Enterocloster clostridioformis]|uniref:hypothetical protein n=1 Tax=Enterocloster clostridioformis TaxID=1531 RepID=UPI0022E765B7|nr:hypothetical protein [Enterocloster clostridioformis]